MKQIYRNMIAENITDKYNKVGITTAKITFFIIFTQSLHDAGYKLFSYRSSPPLIRGLCLCRYYTLINNYFQALIHISLSLNKFL